MIHFLMISAYQIIILLSILLVIFVSALVLASKNETRFHFLIWAAIIIFIPFVGAVSYLIKHFTDKKLAERIL